MCEFIIEIGIFTMLLLLLVSSMCCLVDDDCKWQMVEVLYEYTCICYTVEYDIVCHFIASVIVDFHIPVFLHSFVPNESEH